MSEALPRLLLVDDEATICRMLKIQLQGSYEIEIAASGAEGIKQIRSANEPFHIIVSDYDMPEMDGPTFFAHAREESPNSVRILLTGHREFDVATEAINAGAVFRVVAKPCSARELGPVLEDAYEQYLMKDAERELLNGTLDGSVNLLLDVVSVISPNSVRKSGIAAKRVRMLCDEIHVPNAWEIRLAAMLSSVGSIVATANGASTSPHADHSQLGAKLVRRIPRLAGVADIISHQNLNFHAAKDLKNEPWFKGASILRVALDMAGHLAAGKCEAEAIAALYLEKDDYDPSILATLRALCSPTQLTGSRKVNVPELEEGMMLAEDVVDNDGKLLITKGREITPFLIDRILSFSKAPRGVRQPLEIMAATEANQAEPVPA